MNFSELSKEELHEMSLIEITYQILSDRKQPMAFNEIVDEIVELLGSSKESVVEKIAQFYTDLNIDGRFLNVGGNTWGIKGWYSVDQFEDDIVPTVKKKKKKKAKILDDEYDEVLDEFEDEDLDLDEFEDELDDEDLLDDEDDLEDDLDDDLDDVDDEFEDEDDLLIDDEFEDEDLDEELDEED